MAVYRRGQQGIYHVDFTFRGRRVKRSTGTTAKREAQELERELRAELKARYKRLGSHPSMTLDEAIDRYMLTVIKPKSSPAAARTYLYYLALIQEHFGSATLLENITRADISDFQAALLKSRKPNTVNRYITPLRAVLNKAVEWGVLAAVPRVTTMPAKDERVRFLTSEEESRLLEASPQWLADLIVFYVETGAGKDEARSLKRSEVDLERKPRGVVRFIHTKSGAPRSVPLSRRCQDLLTRLRQERRPDGEQRVFLMLTNNGGGDMVGVGDFKKSWAATLKQAGITELRVHDLRHTFASRLVMKGVPLFDVSKLLGHKSLKMTLRYAYLAPEALDRAISALDEGENG